MASFERLLVVIDAHGADPTRWPEAERSELEDLARSPDVARQLAEARALDTLLAKSVTPDAGALDTLKARILERTRMPGKSTQHTPTPRSVATLSDRRKIAAMSRLRDAWPAAAALAASLLVGAFFGASETGKPAVESFIASAGYETSDLLTLDPLGVGVEELL